jgi:hypothetical protein
MPLKTLTVTQQLAQRLLVINKELQQIAVELVGSAQEPGQKTKKPIEFKFATKRKE